MAGVICGLFIPEPQIRRKAFALHTHSSTPLGKVCAPAFSDDHPDVLTYITRAQKILPAFITYGYILMTRHNEESERDESSLSAARSSGSTHISASVAFYACVGGRWVVGRLGGLEKKEKRAHVFLAQCTPLVADTLLHLPPIPASSCMCMCV